MTIITISRGTLSGGGHFAEMLGERLGYQVISREVLVEAAKKYGASEKRLFEEMEQPPKFWDRLIGHRESYIMAVQATLAEMIVTDRVIYHGQAGQFLLRDLPNVLKLRLIAPQAYRIDAAMEQQKLNHDEAERYIHHIDAQRRKWVHYFYNSDCADPSLYDMVINLEKMSMDTAVDLVEQLTTRPAYKTDELGEYGQILRDFALETRLRASLEFCSEFPENAVGVAVRQGVVHLTGAYLDKHSDDVETFLHRLGGVEQIVTTEEDEQPPALGGDEAESTAADVMIPLTSYPHIHQDVSIREAIVALGASTVRLADGHLIPPRYVMVLDAHDSIVGVISRRDLLKGLIPQIESLERARDQIAHVAPHVDMPELMLHEWTSLFSDAALVNARRPVQGIMASVRATVEVHDNLSVVFSTMLHHHIDLVPVMDKGRAVGVVLMTDVFDTVAQFVLERGGRIDLDPTR